MSDELKDTRYSLLITHHFLLITFYSDSSLVFRMLNLIPIMNPMIPATIEAVCELSVPATLNPIRKKSASAVNFKTFRSEDRLNFIAYYLLRGVSKGQRFIPLYSQTRDDWQQNNSNCDS